MQVYLLFFIRLAYLLSLLIVSGISLPTIIQAHPSPWQPWDEQTLSEAQKQNKPILLVIAGAGTSSYPELTQGESLKLRESGFVAIWLDELTRPDLISFYSELHRATNGPDLHQAAFLLTPDGKPFWSGHFKEEDTLTTLLTTASAQWKSASHQKKLIEKTREIMGPWSNDFPANKKILEDPEQILKAFYNRHLISFDQTHAGFGRKIKHPPSMSLMTLMRIFRRSEAATAREMVVKTLDQLINSPMSSPRGISRISHQEDWQKPDPEKRLGDNALFIMTLIEAYQAFGDSKYLDEAYRLATILKILWRDSTGGLFYAWQHSSSSGNDGLQKVILETRAKTAWLALTAIAFARLPSSQEGEASSYLSLAKNIVDHIEKKHFVGNKLATIYPVPNQIVEQSEDYAYFIWSLIELYFATGDSSFALKAHQLQKIQNKLFWDEDRSGFKMTENKEPLLFIERLQRFDHEQPSVQSVSALNLLRLSELFFEGEYRKQAEMIFTGIGSRLRDFPHHFPFLTLALDFYSDFSITAVISENKETGELAATQLQTKIKELFLPNVVFGLSSPQMASIPLTENKEGRDKPFVFYVCLDRVCKLPYYDEKLFFDDLKQHKNYNVLR